MAITKPTPGGDRDAWGPILNAALDDLDGRTEALEALLDLIQAKGDLMVGTGSGTLGRVPAGSNGALMVADSGETAGVKWSDIQHLTGTGSPEGVVSAPVGSTFTNTEAGGYNGARAWRKASGSGSTGWVVTEGDTGPRSLVSAGLASSFVGASSHPLWTLQRVGPRVTTTFRLNPASAGGSWATPANIFNASVPTGFRIGAASQDVALGTGSVNGAAPAAINALWNNTYLQVDVFASGTWATSDLLIGSASWITTDAWPSSLPGSAL